MRKISALFAILIALSGALGFIAGFDWSAIITSGLFAVALAVAGVEALLGGDLIFLAAAWGLYLGMNLAAYVDVIYSFGQKTAPVDLFGSILLTILLMAGVLGLLMTFIARHQERRA